MTQAARKLRLMIVGPLPPPIGGVETFTQAILESDAFAPFELAHCDTTKKRAKATQGRFDPLNFAWAFVHAMRLLRDIGRFHPDVVYVPVAGTLSGVLRDLLLAALAKRSGAVVVAHPHDGEVHDVLAKGGLLGRCVRAGLGQFDAMLVLGETWRTMFADYGVECPISICPSTARREFFERGAAYVRPPRNGPPVRLLFVGQVGRRKGVYELVRAVAKLRDDGVPVRLTLVGPSEHAGQVESVQALRDELGLADAVCLTGALTGDALYAQFREHDVFVLPSHTEGLPVVLFEAGAFSLPVVTTPVGSIPSLVEDGRNGLLVPPGDVDALAGALRRMAGDAGLRERLAASMRTDLQRFHPDRVAGTIVEAVREAARRKGRA